jgi:hypothetical protein
MVLIAGFECDVGKVLVGSTSEVLSNGIPLLL